MPHLSILDGWWIEAFNGKNGWAFGHEQSAENRDREDAAALYNLLEKEIIPLYYRSSEDGIPGDWVRIMKNAIKSNGAAFSARRMIKQYVTKFYAPALNHARQEEM